jgi:hypothetical protein
VRERAGEAHGIELREAPPTLNHLKGWRNRVEDHALGEYHEKSRDLALQLAFEAGCFQPGAAITDVSSVVYADGKVVKSPLRSKTIEKWREKGRRIDAGLYKQNGEDGASYAMGSKFVCTGVRIELVRNNRVVRNARIMLNATRQAHGKSLRRVGYAGESGIGADEALDLNARVTRLGGRVRAVVYDGAFRGVHIDRLMIAGLNVLSPVNADVAKASQFDLVQDCPCGRDHELVSEDGDLHEQFLLDTGEHFTRPLARKRLHSRPSGQGCAWYTEHLLSCGNTLTTRIDFGGDPVRKRRNTAERVRQHPPDSSVYQQMYGRREEAESTNNIIDRTLYGGRMIAHTANRQLLVMLGFMLARNTLARHALSRSRPAAAA